MNHFISRWKFQLSVCNIKGQYSKTFMMNLPITILDIKKHLSMDQVSCQGDCINKHITC